jgi:hypothetical protein
MKNRLGLSVRLVPILGAHAAGGSVVGSSSRTGSGSFWRAVPLPARGGLGPQPPADGAQGIRERYGLFTWPRHAAAAPRPGPRGWWATTGAGATVTSAVKKYCARRVPVRSRTSPRAAEPGPTGPGRRPRRRPRPARNDRRPPKCLRRAGPGVRRSTTPLGGPTAGRRLYIDSPRPRTRERRR